MIKTYMKPMVVLALVVFGGVAQADVWTGAGDGTSYEDPDNWNPSTNAFPGSLREIDGAYTVTRDVDVTVDRTFVSGGATLNVTAGSHDDSKAGNSIRNFVGNGSVGTVNMSGASTYWGIGHCLGIAHSSNSDGTFNLTGGELNVSRGSANSLVGGYGGNFTLGHSISIGGNSSSTGVTGLMEISGGLLKTRTGIAVAKNGALSLVGSNASTILLGGSNDDAGWFLVSPDGLLKVTADIGGITKIFVEDKANTSTINPFAEFAAGSLLYLTNTTSYGGTWTLLEVENGSITNNGLALAPGVDTNIWSFAIDNSGVNGLLTVTAAGEPAPVIPDVTLTVGDTQKQMMRYGLDYERLWYWNSTAVANAAEIADWSVNDCNIDYIRTAMNSGYELTEGTYDLGAYTSKIIPMMTAMQNANPNIKWFASPRPLDEAVSGASWQPYPLWVTGATSYTSGDYDFNATKCAEYMIRYLLLMKSNGFKITYMDLTNEWQNDFASGGRLAPDDAVAIKQVFDDYLANPWPHPALDSSLLLEADDFPLMVGSSSWNYSQGSSWISRFTTSARRNAIDIASSHNTDRTGTAQQFADAAKAALGDDVEIWETEQHGWKSTSGENEVTSFYYYLESIRAGFTGINGWLAIGTPNQGHCYLLNENGAVTRNVKYYIFQKLANTSNYGRALDINQPAEFTSTAALIRENLMTVWVINDSTESQVVKINIGDREISDSEIHLTRWSEPLPVEGVSDVMTATTDSSFIATVEGNSLYCFEITLEPTGADFPFLQAENYTGQTGTAVLPCADEGGGEMVGFSDAGDEIFFDVDVSRTASYDIAFRVSSESANIQFDLYDGTNVIAGMDRIATGGDQNWTTVYKTVALNGGATTLSIKATGGDWNLNWIKCFTAVETASELENLALNQAASASSVWEDDPAYAAENAVDGNAGTRWAAAGTSQYLSVLFYTPTLLNKISIKDYGDRIKSYEIQYFDTGWQTAYVGGNPDDGVYYSFPTVEAPAFRLLVTDGTNPSVWEFGLYYDPGFTESDPVVSMDIGSNSVSLTWAGVPGATYALEHSTNLITDAFTPLEARIPVHESTNTNIIAMPDESAFYRVILE